MDAKISGWKYEEKQDICIELQYYILIKYLLITESKSKIVIL